MEQNITLTVVNERATVTSLQIAEHFGKRHGDVIRAIRNLELPDDFTQRNFASIDYKDKNGDLQPMYSVTRDGFAILAMGFTGKAALEWKIKFLDAFNAMEKEIQRLHAENQALLKLNLRNSHVAITTLQEDNGGRAHKGAPALAN